MTRDAQRVATVLFLVASGFVLWPSTRESMAIGFWIVALVYAILTSPRRWL